MDPAKVYSDQNADLSHLEHDERFRKAWWATEGIPGSFTRLNAAKLWEFALQAHGIIVEVGVDQGRSTCILLNAAQISGATLILVDSWESILIDNKAKVEALLDKYPDVRAQILHMTSVDAAAQVTAIPDMVHIDAYHYSPLIEMDCEAWLPKLRSGGVVCFHDVYATFPDVTRAVDHYTEGYDDLGTWDSLAIRRKP